MAKVHFSARLHTQKRYLERFGKLKEIPIKEMSDQMYDEIVEMFSRGFYTYSRLSKNKRGGTKAIIDYEGMLMWGIFSKRQNVLKTVYPVSRKERQKYNLFLKKEKKQVIEVENAKFYFNKYEIMPKSPLKRVQSVIERTLSKYGLYPFKFLKAS